MKLNLSQIKDVTTGAVKITEEADGFHFHRFTEEQEALFLGRRDDFYRKTFCTSGVQLRFKTDSQLLRFGALVSHEEARNYFAIDIFVNGEMIDSVDNYRNVTLPRAYTGVQLPVGEYERSYDLGAGEKEVRIYLPWSANAVLKDFTLDDGATLEPIRPKYKLLCFGDSITHGYDLLHPSSKYATNLADLLDAEEFNKAMGGDIYFPDLAATKESFSPDYITVAFGTNDWYKCTEEEFRENCSGFYKNISETYPDSKIFAITPIWRKDLDEKREFGPFENVAQIISDTVKEYKNIALICGFDLVPHTDELYADLRLHPNDAGAAFHYQNLSRQIGEILQLTK